MSGRSSYSVWLAHWLANGKVACLSDVPRYSPLACLHLLLPYASPAPRTCLCPRRWNVVFGFHVPQYPQGHQATDYWRWVKSHAAYSVQYQVRCRVCVRKTREAAHWRVAWRCLAGAVAACGGACRVVCAASPAPGLSRLQPLLCADASPCTAMYCPVPQIGYEPYILMHRDYVPFYDERFRGYYW